LELKDKLQPCLADPGKSARTGEDYVEFLFDVDKEAKPPYFSLLNLEAGGGR